MFPGCYIQKKSDVDLGDLGFTPTQLVRLQLRCDTATLTATTLAREASTMLSPSQSHRKEKIYGGDTTPGLPQFPSFS